jgi:hypothetical protein
MSRFRSTLRTWPIPVCAVVWLLEPLGVSHQGSVLIDIHGLSPREVKSEAFALTAPQDVRIEAIGAESMNRWDQVAKAVRGVRRTDGGGNVKKAWTGNAWILDVKTRAVVWELSSASTSEGAHNTRVFNGSVKLPEGSYAAYYAAFPDGEYWAGDNQTERKWHWFGNQRIDDFKIVVRGSGQRLEAGELERLRQSTPRAVVSLRGTAAEQLQQTGFELSARTDVDIDAVGEAREDGEFDYGWIINADTRETIWKLTWRDSAPAGGAAKNRAARLTRTLPPGRYAAFYATDDTHDPSEWNSQPPYDPEAWGLTLRVHDSAARAAVKSFAYEHVPQSATIVELTGIGNRESRRRGFTLTRPMDVRVYAIGEGRDGQMYDYGWITSASSRARVWEMRYKSTDAAGGDAKNRIVDTTLRLDKGSYIVHYVSDDSHSTGSWNAPAPADGRRWGITVLAADGVLDRSAVAPYEDKGDPTVLAQLTEVRDNGEPRKQFTLERETAVRIYALGEGAGGEMHDYGWIEDARTGRRVWEMTYRITEHAGGAAKNRKFQGTIRLPAGEYVVRYETDGSHAFGDWNAAAPDQPEAWGITLYRAPQ